MISLTQTIFLLDVLCKPDDKHRKCPHRHIKNREKSKNVTMEKYHITKEDSKRGRKGETIKHPENNEEDSICMSLSEVAQSYPTLCDPMDCSLPGSSVHGIFQAGVLEWVAICPYL